MVGLTVAELENSRKNTIALNFYFCFYQTVFFAFCQRKNSNYQICLLLKTWGKKKKKGDSNAMDAVLDFFSFSFFLFWFMFCKQKSKVYSVIYHILACTKTKVIQCAKVEVASISKWREKRDQLWTIFLTAIQQPVGFAIILVGPCNIFLQNRRLFCHPFLY